jgi:nicotinamidase-related amidase
MLNAENTFLILIDVQGKLAQIMHEADNLFSNLEKLIKGMQLLEIPIIWLEQYPEGLGFTTPRIADLLQEQQPLCKMSFSSCGSAEFQNEIDRLNRRQALLCGIETHVCVYQTACDLITLDYEVQVVSDAVSSRTMENRELGLSRIQQAGGLITGLEMALFELMGSAEHPVFRQVVSLVK